VGGLGGVDQERAGSRRKPPTMGSKAHPPVADAPGTYVLG